MERSQNFTVDLNFSNQSYSQVCHKSEIWWFHANNAAFFAYKILMPIHFILGTIGRSLCLLAYQREAKKEKPYVYQIFVTATEILENLAFTCFSLAFRWFSGIDGTGALWYQQSYPLMWYSAHLSLPFLGAFTTTGLLLSVSMTADRLLALAKPFVYKAAKHKKHQAIALVLCYLIGLSTSIFDVFRFRVAAIDGKGFRILPNLAYSKTKLAACLARLRDAVRALGLATLVIGNILVLSHFRKRIVGKEKQTNNHNGSVSRPQRKEAEKTLVLLTVSESVMTSIGMSFLIVYYALVYIDPKFMSCDGLLVAPCLDATMQLASILSFFLMLRISRRFRNMIMNAVTCGGRTG